MQKMVKLNPLPNDQNNLTMFWPIEYNRIDKRDAEEYLLSLLNNEGDSSLYRALSSETLATKVTADTFSFADSQEVLRINVVLTKKGVENQKVIVSHIMNYIEGLKDVPLNQEYYEELKKARQPDIVIYRKILD